MSAFDIVVIGSSWGGLRALSAIVRDLPGTFPLPVAVAQHRSPDAPDGALAAVLGSHAHLPVREAEDKEPIERGVIYVAPADYHLLVERGRFALSIDERVRFSRPSVDVLFESAADAYGSRVVAVVLTGANDDGAAGLAAVKRSGGFTIVQDPATAEKGAMPRAAIHRRIPDLVLPLDAIARRLVELCTDAREDHHARA